MQTDMIARKKANQLWVIIGVCSLGLSITACDNEMLSRNDKETAGAELRFDTSISDDPSTRANGASLIEGTAFPNGEHTFGMFITDGDGAQLVTGSDDNMRLTLTRATGVEDDWKHTNKNDKEMLSLSVNHGGVVNISGYYPWVEDASPEAVPFDLTGDPDNWKDLMYLTSPSDPVTVLDGKTIPLNFSHAYCWVKVVLSKLTDKNKVFVGAVSITNSNNDLKRIINRGQIDPKTGNVIPTTSQAGSIVFKCPQPIELILNQADDTPGYSPVEFNFLVPEFMSADTKDFEIIIQVTAMIESPGSSGGAYEILSFPINKKFLNNAADGHGGTLFGFQRGKCNRYDIIYNNSEMALSLASWDNATIPDKPNTPNHQVGQQQQQDVITVKFNNQGVKPEQNKLPPTDHMNHDLLGEVADGNNGYYVTTVPDPNVTSSYDAWKPFLYADKFNPWLQVSIKDAAGGGIVPWKDAETGVLRAKQACIDFKGGGYTDWRLPRLGELGMLVYFRVQGSGIPSPDLTQEGYWSATEHGVTEAFCAIRQTPGSTPIPRVVSKTGRMSVRCVRDLEKPNPGI